MKFLPVLLITLALIACPDSTSGSSGSGSGSGGGSGGSGSGSGSGSGGSGGSGSGSPFPKADTFSTALASKVSAATTDILAPGATAETNKVVGLAVQVDAAKAGKATDDTAAASTALEVWLTDTAYFNADGTAKEAAAGKAWLVVWDAYNPAGASDPTTTSVKAADATTFAADKVTIGDSATGADKPGRRKVQLGNALLTGGAVIVVSIYQPDTTATALTDATDRVAQYQLTITQAPAPAHALDLTKLPNQAELTISGTHGAPAVGLASSSGIPGQSAALTADSGKVKATLRLNSSSSLAKNGETIVWGDIKSAGTSAAIYALIFPDANYPKTTHYSETALRDSSGTPAAVIIYDNATLPGLAKGTISLANPDPYGQQWSVPLEIEFPNVNS